MKVSVWIRCLVATTLFLGSVVCVVCSAITAAAPAHATVVENPIEETCVDDTEA
jgi:hypothetical protein